MPDQNNRLQQLLARLCGGTCLGAFVKRQVVPDNVADALRHMAEDTSDIDEDNPYEFQRARFNRIWAGREAYAADINDPSQVAQMKSLRGAITAYWTSSKWAEAWASTGMVAGFSTLFAKSTVWMADATANFTGSIANLAGDANAANMHHALHDLGQLGMVGGVMFLSSTAMEYTKFDLQRRMGGWLTRQFGEAILNQPDTVYRITHNRNSDSQDPDAMPDSPHQRIGFAVRQLPRNLVYLGSSAFTTAMTSAFIVGELYNKSVPVGFMDRFGAFLNEKFPNGMIDFQPGDNGLFVLGLTTVLGFATASLPLAYKYGKALGDTDEGKQKADGAFMDSLIDTFNRGQAIAESQGHNTQRENFNRTYDLVDKAWDKDNKAFTKYLGMSFIQNFIGHNFVATLPGLAGVMAGTLTFKGFVANQMLVSNAIHSTQFIINAAPSWGQVRSSGERLAEMAQMIGRVADRKKFYEMSGVHDFKYRTLAANDAAVLKVNGLALYQRGAQEPFVSIDEMAVKKGDHVYIDGPSGCGKSSLFKALTGLSPYGRGDMAMRGGTRLFLARQEPDIDAHLSLAQLVVYGTEPLKDMDGSDAAVMQRKVIAQCLRTVGLGKFATEMDSKNYEGKVWPEVLSGGQKKRLVLARALYQQPDILMLDEATAGLDQAGQREFFDIINMHMPQATVLAIVHKDTDNPPDFGNFKFNKTLQFAEGHAALNDRVAGAGALPVKTAGGMLPQMS